MTAMHRATAILALLLLPAAALSADCGSLGELRWLLGSWTADGERATFHESWAEVAPRTFEGAGLERSKPGGEAKGGEVLRLVEMAGSVFYLSKVTHNELPVAFRLAGCEDGSYVFENPAHDFPKRLAYRRDGDDRLVVRASDGGENGFTLDFRRDAAAPDARAAVLAAEDARFAAMVAGDDEAMRRAFSPDLAYVHSTGRVESRDQLIETIRSGRLRYEAVEPLERDVGFPDSGTAVVRGRAHVRARAGDAPVDMHLRYLAVYVREEGAWRLRDWQSLREP